MAPFQRLTVVQGNRAWFNGSFVWLVVGGDGPARPTASWALRLDSEVFLAVRGEDADDTWRVDEVFRVNAGDAAVRLRFASWSMSPESARRPPPLPTPGRGSARRGGRGAPSWTGVLPGCTAKAPAEPNTPQ